MKADWHGEMKLWRGLILDTKILEIILYIMLHKLMGLYFLKDKGLGTFGMRMIRELFIAFVIDPSGRRMLQLLSHLPLQLANSFYRMPQGNRLAQAS